jgi:hypothetical protein
VTGGRDCGGGVRWRGLVQQCLAKWAGAPGTGGESWGGGDPRKGAGAAVIHRGAGAAMTWGGF